MKRPLGLTLLAVYFGTVASWHLSILRDTSVSLLVSNVGTIVTLLWIASGLVSGVAAVGLWRMRRWAPKAVAAAAGLMVALAIARQLTDREGLGQEAIISIGILLFIMWFAVSYARDRIAAAEEQVATAID